MEAPGGVSARFLVVVAFVIERAGEILLLRRSPAKDHAPGEWEGGSGRVEAGETPEQAVVREAREETGLAVEVVGPLDTFHYYRGAAREEAIGIVFHCRATGGALRLSEEHVEARWLRRGEPIDVEGPVWLARALGRLAAPRA